MQKPFSKYQLGLLGASIPTADTQQPPSSLTLPYVELFMLHLVSPGVLCRWDAGGRWIALNARHWITGPNTWGNCPGRGEESVERWTGATLVLMPSLAKKSLWCVIFPLPYTYLFLSYINTLLFYWRAKHFLRSLFFNLFLQASSFQLPWLNFFSVMIRCPFCLMWSHYKFLKITCHFK